jgi:hypothetical protein
MAKKETTKKDTATKKVAKKSTTKAEKAVKPARAKKAKEEVKEEVLEIPTVQVINGDPAVLGPVGEPENDEKENPYEVTSLVAEEIVNESQPEEYDSAKPAKKKEENNHKPSKIRKILGYFWNGQEFDY